MKASLLGKNMSQDPAVWQFLILSIRDLEISFISGEGGAGEEKLAFHKKWFMFLLLASSDIEAKCFGLFRVGLHLYVDVMAINIHIDTLIGTSRANTEGKPLS